ncbi:MAG TPA: AraC family transcriptional regulator [Candidatus Acidoferrum sp.]
MNAVEKALWFIESHFAGEITLEEIAKTAGVSRFHMTRAFGTATGLSIMRYVRGRRLTEAAKALSRGAPDILSLALDAGYGSHEAFTRAFRDEFGVTPEMIRAQGHLKKIDVVEPVKLDETLLIKLEPPRLESGRRLLIAGIGARYTCDASAGIPSQWQRFLPHLDHIPGQLGRTAYGVRCNSGDAGSFHYVCGVEVRDFLRTPADWSRVRIPEQKYAVFSQRDHISTIRRTWNTIWNEWLPNSEYEVADAPDFERYGEHFNSAAGIGGFEIWIPVKASSKQ